MIDRKSSTFTKHQAFPAPASSITQAELQAIRHHNFHPMLLCAVSFLEECTIHSTCMFSHIIIEVNAHVLGISRRASYERPTSSSRPPSLSTSQKAMAETLSPVTVQYISVPSWSKPCNGNIFMLHHTAPVLVQALHRQHISPLGQAHPMNRRCLMTLRGCFAACAGQPLLLRNLGRLIHQS
jgi:hypothetical protein